MIFAVSGVTLTGNLGGVAMLLTVRQELTRRFPGAELALLSISPRQDRAVAQPAGMRIVSCHWLVLIGCYFPLSIIAAPLRNVGLVRRLLGRIGYFRALLECAAVIDVSGIAFVDGRGPALLAYNLACCAPGFLLGKPVIKLAQTLGPFAEPLNRRAAHWALSRCAAVIARGEQSGRHLQTLGVPVPVVRPDVTFCLEVPAPIREWAAGQLSFAKIAGAPVLLSPSRVLQRTCARHGVDLADIFARLIERLQAKRLSVALLAHSQAAGIAKNDDLGLCTEIVHRLPAAKERPVVFTTDDPVRARALIGCASLFLGCRYHSIVSAYAMAAPAIALSWNHKYEDLASLWGQTEWLVTARNFTLEPLIAKIERLQAAIPVVQAALRERGPAVRAAAAENFSVLEQSLARVSR